MGTLPLNIPFPPLNGFGSLGTCSQVRSLTSAVNLAIVKSVALAITLAIMGRFAIGGSFALVMSFAIMWNHAIEWTPCTFQKTYPR